MAHKIHGFLPATAEPPTDRQRLFIRYFSGVLIDLTLLNLFAEYWHNVVISSFTISLLAAIVLQALLKLTMAIEHRVAGFFNDRPGGFNRFMRFFAAWLVLFGSKFVILEALVVVFGDSVHFGGPLHGVVALIVVAVVMVVAEELIALFVRRLG